MVVGVKPPTSAVQHAPVLGRVLVVVVMAATISACGKRKSLARAGDDGAAPDAAAAGGSDGGIGAQGDGALGGAAGTTGQTCAPGDETVAPRRLVRLSRRQIANSIASLVDAPAKDLATMQLGIGDASELTFLPLDSPRETTSLAPTFWGPIDSATQSVAQYVFDHFGAVTGCSPTTDACARTFLAAFAERAYRRPLDQSERDELEQEYVDLQALGSTTEEVVQYSVYAILDAPEFLYRWELGQPPAMGAASVSLTAYEKAAQLSFFLGDAPPDADLLAAATQGTLDDAAGIVGEVNRLVSTSAAVQQHLSHDVMFSYFKLNLLPNVVLDSAVYPANTVAVRDAMTTEAILFLDATLWTGPLEGLLTSRTTAANIDLAPAIYQVPAPAGSSSTTFTPLMLPDGRSGLLTLPAFLTLSSRPARASLVLRGLRVAEAFVCAAVPPPPAVDPMAIPVGQTAKQQVDARAANAACSFCHGQMDPYGLVLDGFDGIGITRTVDEQGRPIETSTTLPAAAGGGPASTAPDVARGLVAGGSFQRCMARSLLQYALADAVSAPVDVNGCAVRAVSQDYGDGDGTFAALLRAVAASRAANTRTVK